MSNEPEEYMPTEQELEASQHKWLIDYAKLKYQYTLNRWDSLENKADQLVRYLGGSIPILLGAVIVSTDKLSIGSTLSIIPTILLLIASMILAVASRRIKIAFEPACVAEAQKYVAFYKNAAIAEFEFVSEWKNAIDKQDIACDEKAEWLQWSFNALLSAIVCVVLPLVAVFIEKACK